MTTVAKHLIEVLKAEGVRHIFGVPGGQPLAITDAIYDEPELEFVATRHENAAAHAADAVGRMTGKPGVCLATTGPGATNLITGVGGGFRDSSPMIVLTANNNRMSISRDDAQDADHVALFQSICKWSVQINHPGHAREVLSEAFQRATTGTPGPVHVDFTRDVLSEELPEDDGGLRRPMRTRIPGDAAQIGEAVTALGRARRPVLWAGNGVKISGASDEVLAFSERLDVPVITTFNGIGAVPNTHDNVFGVKSRMAGILGEEILAKADLLVAVGNSLNGPSTSRWTTRIPREIVHIDIEPAIIGKHYPDSIGVWGDAKMCLRQILERHDAQDGVLCARRAWLEGLKARREEWHASRVDIPGYDDRSPVMPQALMKALGERMPEDTVYAVDAGNPGVWSNLLPIGPRNSYMKPVGFGNMAFALPASIATKLTVPERPVVCLVGDGSLGMSLAELETAVRCGVPIAVVVMNDRAYGNIKQEQLHYFGPRYIGVDFVDAHYADIARGFGAEGERVETIDAFQKALDRATGASGPYLIDVIIDPDETVWEKPF